MSFFDVNKILLSDHETDAGHTLIFNFLNLLNKVEDFLG